MIDIKNKFCLQMLDGMLEAFAASPNISPNILFVGMRRTLSKVIVYDLTAILDLFFSNLLSKSAILTSSLLYRYFQSLQTCRCSGENRSWILLAMLDAMLDEMLDAFDHLIVSINKLYNFFKKVLDEMLDAFDQGLAQHKANRGVLLR